MMERCIVCGSETQVSESGRPFCLKCRDAHETEREKTVAELQAENHHLKRQLQAVMDLTAARKQLRYERSVYWKYDEAGNLVDGPFCPKCLEEDHVRRLTPGAANGVYRCVHHKALFTTAPVGAAVRKAGA